MPMTPFELTPVAKPYNAAVPPPPTVSASTPSPTPVLRKAVIQSDRLAGPMNPPGTSPGPVAPVAPVGPIGPIAPIAPVGPVGPTGPIAPVAPVGPVAPAGPGAPVAPVGPGAPIGPVAPWGPGDRANAVALSGMRAPPGRTLALVRLSRTSKYRDVPD